MIDQKIFLLIHELSGKSRILDFFGIFLAEYFGYFLLLGAVIMIAMESDWRKKFNYYALLALSVIVSRGIATEVIRFAYHRLRPFIVLGFSPLIPENSYSFPSGHAAFYFALAGVVWMLDKKQGWRFVIAAVLMGLARIFVGVHWPLDIVGGAVVGFASVWFSDWLLKKDFYKK